MSAKPQQARAARDKRLADDYKRVFSTDEGKRVIADLVAKSRLMSLTTTVDARLDPYMLAYEAGQRDLVRGLLAQIDGTITIPSP